MPPNLKRLFLGAVDVGKRLAAANRRRDVAIARFGHITLPDGSRRYPEPYIEALLRADGAPITAGSVRKFNSSPAAREAIRQSDIALQGRIREWHAVPAETEEGHLSVNALTWILGVDRSCIARWRRDGLVEYKQIGNHTFIQIADLLTKCRWVLPTE